MIRKAVAHLSRVDPVMQRVIGEVGPCRFATFPDGTHFNYIARSIVYQQLSGKAAAMIFSRVCSVAGGAEVHPEALLKTRPTTLRGAGLSKQKLGYLIDLARRVDAAELAVERLHELPDDEVLAQMTQVKGIGTWTVQMFLMFRLGRPDILPSGDLGVQKGMKLAYRMRKLPTPKRVEAVGARWAPYRSIASWYLWRILDVDAARRRPEPAA